jgi:hypothetical protein
MTDEKKALPAPRSWRKLRAGEIFWMAAAVLVLAGCVAIGWYFRHGQLLLVNGLDVPVVVEIDGGRTALGPGERGMLRLSLGAHEARVLSPSGALIDEDAITIAHAGTEAFQAYNVLGAAPLFVETVEYTSRATPDKEPTIAFHGGHRFVAVEHVDYLFEKPPQSLQVQQPSGVVHKIYVDVLAGGWRSTVGYLLSREPARAADVATALTLAAPDDIGTLATVVQVVTASSGPAAGAHLAQKYRDAHPGNEELHRAYQSCKMRLGLDGELSEEYTKWYERSDKGPAASSLLARVLPPREARAVLDEALTRHADAAVLLLRKARIAVFEGQLAEADALFQRAAGSEDYRYYADEHAYALVALGRTGEAISRIAALLGKEKATDLALLYAQLARLPDAGQLPSPPWTYVDELSDASGAPWRKAWARSALGEPPGSTASPSGRDFVETLQLQAGQSAAVSWSTSAALPPDQTPTLHPTVALLLGAEFLRAGDADLADRLLAPHPELLLSIRAIAEYVMTGAEPPGLFRLSPEQRAALDFVRGRKLESEGKPAEALYEAARRRDAFRSVVSRAMSSWAKPTPPGAAPTPPGAAPTSPAAVQTPPRPKK